MAFIQDPRMRQRWNEIQHTTETVTENAAAGIWTFQHRYITPCLASICNSLDSCTALCIGDREERARRARERDRGARRSRAEYTFDFYDDWDDDLFDDDGAGAADHDGILGSWGGGRREDWDRLLAGTGSVRRHEPDPDAAVVVGEQPRRKRGMSYGGTRSAKGGGGKRKLAPEEDPTVIPSTAPLGFLGRLPFRIGGTLRYKPSAANLKEHPGQHVHDGHGGTEQMPLLGGGDSDDEDGDARRQQDHVPEVESRNLGRTRSNTTGSGATSDSYRSRNDLFPSDGEGEEDAIPLDDEFAVTLVRVETDRGSNRTRSSKGKRRADGTRSMSRTVSGTTIASSARGSLHGRDSFASIGETIGAGTPTLDELRREEEEARREEDEEVEKRREAARQLAHRRGLSVVQHVDSPEVGEQEQPGLPQGDGKEESSKPESEPFVVDDEVEQDESVLERTRQNGATPEPISKAVTPEGDDTPERPIGPTEDFVPARLPYFR